ncbi:biotin attachment protein [Sulfolobus sp. A20-N-F6]|uniref:lipoyl domain-containing protein n=2 Tax=Sulfolobaceae TaxID=118883 RepID=UPI000845CAA0|nr:lipoyl domain-containing protein [Sulfolobus sp. A20]TRM75402.1 biotin attachment protein [Sulfolobus sp. B5]TRM76830.1 biotin attachment protein [Sulfolobus sp. E5]TRM77238.1 biotin attachment protein [Sulfolobus sp. A20-N-F8]TRM81493.1 biotin attachment protein [Sulfolobus sp. D5]TRM84272.1 biotin attachment protein [Sulfolobus sp. A20-N-F6]TRM89644.1 biotin attachment protein [Sulfolobus sp. C3]TRN02729.1 biotin attachment protein [Sulfolobus sp. F1]TRN04730.1 biotin attachment protei
MRTEIKVPEDIWPRRRDWEGEVVSVYIKDGDHVNENDIVAEIEIEKVVLKIVSKVSGKIVRVEVKEGDKVKPGSTIAVVEAI